MSDCLKLKIQLQNCYKCIRYCPVKSIRFSDDQAHIIEEDCILRRMLLACPQNAKEIRRDLMWQRAYCRRKAGSCASRLPSLQLR